jgi:hypothetical protein
MIAPMTMALMIPVMVMSVPSSSLMARGEAASRRDAGRSTPTG